MEDWLNQACLKVPQSVLDPGVRTLSLDLIGGLVTVVWLVELRTKEACERLPILEPHCNTLPPSKIDLMAFHSLQHTKQHGAKLMRTVHVVSIGQ